MAYFEKAISMGERYGFYNNLSDIYISMIDLYTDLNEYESAEIAGEKAIKYANLIVFPESLQIILQLEDDKSIILKFPLLV